MHALGEVQKREKRRVWNYNSLKFEEIPFMKKCRFTLIRGNYMTRGRQSVFQSLYLSKRRFKKTVPESECGRGKFVHDGRVAFLVVTVVEAVGLQGQLVQVDGVPAQHAGQKLVPC